MRSLPVLIIQLNRWGQQPTQKVTTEVVLSELLSMEDHNGGKVNIDSVVSRLLLSLSFCSLMRRCDY